MQRIRKPSSACCLGALLLTLSSAVSASDWERQYTEQLARTAAPDPAVARAVLIQRIRLAASHDAGSMVYAHERLQDDTYSEVIDVYQASMVELEEVVFTPAAGTLTHHTLTAIASIDDSVLRSDFFSRVAAERQSEALPANSTRATTFRTASSDIVATGTPRQEITADDVAALRIGQRIMDRDITEVVRHQILPRYAQQPVSITLEGYDEDAQQLIATLGWRLPHQPLQEAGKALGALYRHHNDPHNRFSFTVPAAASQSTVEQRRVMEALASIQGWVEVTMEDAEGNDHALYRAPVWYLSLGDCAAPALPGASVPWSASPKPYGFPEQFALCVVGPHNDYPSSYHHVPKNIEAKIPLSRRGLETMKHLSARLVFDHS